jgi:hypothetical protein
MRLVAVTLILSTLSGGTSAARRRAFPSFQDGTTDVLTSIYSGEYSQVYVNYHQCIWSEYGGDDGNSGCGGGGDGGGGGDDYWYMGNTECYRANVAYSLYGVKVGQDTPERPCRKQNYINSLFTTNGVQTFGSAVGLANYGDASSSCTVSDQQNDGGNNQQAATHNSMLYPNANSYTTYCKSGKFVTALFAGARCTGTNRELELLGSLDDLNGEIGNVGCNLVYDAANESSGGRTLEQEQDNAAGDDGGNRAGLWDLLTYSSVCSLVQYRDACPDPYGAKSSFDMNPSTSNSVVKQMGWVDWLAFVFIVIGLALLVMSYCMKDRRDSGDSSDTKRGGNGIFFGRSRSRTRNQDGSKSLRRSRSPVRSRSRGRSSSRKIGDGDDNNNAEKKGFFRRLFSSRRNTSSETEK